MGVKSKIYVTIMLWIALCAGMFAYGFKVLDKSNRATKAKITGDKEQMLVLQKEEESYRLAQKDLQEMAKQKYQPEGFFSQDITLVKEIQSLENLGKTLGVELSLGGISGTINNAPKAKSQGQLFMVPYSLSVSGSLPQVVGFIETLENMDFVTSFTSLNFNAAGSGNVSASMSANLYVRKK